MDVNDFFKPGVCLFNVKNSENTTSNWQAINPLPNHLGLHLPMKINRTMTKYVFEAEIIDVKKEETQLKRLRKVVEMFRNKHKGV